MYHPHTCGWKCFASLQTAFLIALLGTGNLLLWQTAQADEQTIELKMPNGVTSVARFNSGDKSKPAVLILHGFLQTAGFSTVQRLADTLSDADYTLLAPNLSLGIDRRKASLSCGAIHLHSIDSEVEEIQVWVNWLKQQGHQQIVLIGHSFGSLQLLAYQHAKAEPSIRGLILTSLIYIDEHLPDETIKKISQLAHNNETPPMPQTYRFSFCEKYPTLPQHYWSYIHWNQDAIKQALEHLKTPVHLIIGTQDNRINNAWMEQLLLQGVKLHKIDGASHFFDAEHEFDLHGLVEEILEKLADES